MRGSRNRLRNQCEVGCRKQQNAEGRRDRERESRLQRLPGVECEQGENRQAERRKCGAPPATERADEQYRRHDGGSEHRGVGADDDHECRERCTRGERTHPAARTEARYAPGHGGDDQPCVAARHRSQVAEGAFEHQIAQCFGNERGVSDGEAGHQLGFRNFACVLHKERAKGGCS